MYKVVVTARHVPRQKLHLREERRGSCCHYGVPGCPSRLRMAIARLVFPGERPFASAIVLTTEMDSILVGYPVGESRLASSVIGEYRTLHNRQVLRFEKVKAGTGHEYMC